MGFLGVRFAVRGGWGIPPLPKTCWNCAETWNFVRKYTIQVALENIPFSTKDFLILLMSALSCKRKVLFSVFKKQKATINDNKRFMDHSPESGFWIAPN